jgi:hypothetical protein
MTRINCVPVTELCDAHLIAEYRELPRVFKLAKVLSTKQKPTEYVLGKGHVLFFYDKLKYLVNRQSAILIEMHLRGFKATHNNPWQLVTSEHVAQGLHNNWHPSDTDKEINRARLIERLANMSNKKWTNRQTPEYGVNV